MPRCVILSVFDSWTDAARNIPAARSALAAPTASRLQYGVIMKNLQNLLENIDQLIDAPPPSAPCVTRAEDADELAAALERFFGLSTFRSGQREIVESILNGGNTLAAFPTGYGKSLCYQLPALMQPGVAIIVSPLISLMKDQVDALRGRGIHSVGLINSSLSMEEYQAELDRLKRGEIKLLYAAPERFRSRRFLARLDSFPISLFVIDEAHCISQWGHDFRPAYLALHDAIRVVHPRSIALFTATATPDVRADILRELAVDQCEVFVRSIERPNLKFSVCAVADESEKYSLLDACLERLEGKGIIYAGRRRDTEEIAEYLRADGRRADYYHAGRDAQERKRVQDGFFDDGPDGIDIIVATNAFGMGIDKANIRYIVHWAMTGTLEEYYQEAGRAGRDGKASHCVLFYSPNDRRLREWFIKEDAPNKRNLLKILKLIETFPALHQFRMIPAEELEWLSGFSAGKIRVGISHLQKLGFLRRLYDIASKLSIRTPFVPDFGLESDNLRALLAQLRTRSELNVMEFCRDLGLRPDELMEQLIDLQSDGYLWYWGSEDSMLIELLRDSNLFASISEDQMGFEDYVRSRRRQLDQMVLYALAEDCRGRAVRKYFGEAVEKDYQCGNCDRCDPACRVVEA